jgi:hypothetical protein
MRAPRLLALMAVRASARVSLRRNSVSSTFTPIPHSTLLRAPSLASWILFLRSRCLFQVVDTIQCSHPVDAIHARTRVGLMLRVAKHCMAGEA